MLTTWRHFAARHPRTVDATAAVLLTVIALVGAAITEREAPALSTVWRALPSTVLAGTAVLWRRSHHRAVVLVTTACVVFTIASGYPANALLLAPAVFAVSCLALHDDRRTTYTYAGATAALTAVTATLRDPTGLPVDVANTATWFLLAAMWGQQIQLRRAYLDAVHARAEHAERTREQEARHRVGEERVRIARELHDVVAHHLAVANAQAGTASHLVRTRPEQAQRMLDGLADTTSQALRELKATVGLLRSRTDPDTPLEPAPGLTQLPDLLASFMAAGLQVHFTTEGVAQPLSPGTDLTAYRIIQEALTNVTKHAAPADAHVRLAYARRHLTITVTNDAADRPDTSSDDAVTQGFGLIGMRERAHSVGGDLHTGPRTDGGFEVSTSLPLHPTALKKDETTP
ncbi:sensor histidine kinase [Streptomyces sp. NPDC005373]|uniref:sensor histidine kinase n=1 Tax=unclassified Streptomyces TaxID=2593676 RepID=UPI0033ACE215